MRDPLAGRGNLACYTLSLRASETSVATLGRSPSLRHATRATSPVSSGEPTPGRAVFDYCHCETRLRVVATLGRSPPLRHATRATSPVSSGEPTPGRVYYCGINILALTASLFDIVGQAFVFYAPYFAINFINADSLLENCLLSASSIFSDEYFSTSALSSVKVFSS